MFGSDENRNSMVRGFTEESDFAENNSLVGTWQLLSHCICDASGRETYPYGREAIGYATYTAAGYMSLTVASDQRERFASVDPVAARVGEWVAAAKTYLSYCGRYEIVAAQRMICQIEASLFPNWTGARQERYFRLQGDRLQTSTPPLLYGGKLQTSQLSWQRVSQTAIGE